MAWLKKRGGRWHLYWLENGRERCKSTGLTDHRCAEQQLSKFHQRKERGEAGLFDKYEASKVTPLWINPPALGATKDKPQAGHINDFLADLNAKGRSDMYRYSAEKRLRKLLTGCAWATWPDITADSFSAWRETPIEQRQSLAEDGKIGAATANQYLEIARTFCGWMVKRGRMPSNPLLSLEKMSEADDVRRERRALTEDETGRLIANAGEFSLVYRLILGTGLRRSEAEQLQWGDVRLTALPSPYIALRAATTKAKRADSLPLRADLAKALQEARGDAGDGDRVFARIPTMEEHRGILAAAGIEFETEAGRADFHALRHTFGTMLSKAGVAPRVAMELMRHTDLRLTMKVYTDPRVFDLSGAVESLPAIQAIAATATGTDGKNCPVNCPVSLPLDSPTESNSVQANGGEKRRKAAVITAPRRGSSKSVGSPAKNRQVSSNPRSPASKTAVNHAFSEVLPRKLYRPAPESTPLSLNLPADLAEVVQAWPHLPDALKGGIAAMVRAAKVK